MVPRLIVRRQPGVMIRFLAMGCDGIGPNKDRRPKGRRSVDSRIWPESVGQDIPTANAFGGQDVERSLGEVVRRIAVVTVGPKRGLLVPQACWVLASLLLLGEDSAIGSLCLPDTNSFSVGVVEEGGRVRFPRAIEVVRLTTTVLSWKLGLHSARRACSQWCSVMGLQSRYLAWSCR